MSSSPLETALRSLVACLESTSREKDQGANPKRPPTKRECERLLALAVPDDVRTIVERIADFFETPRTPKSGYEERAARALGWLKPVLRDLDKLLERPLSVFPGVGPKRAAQLSGRGLSCVADVLFQLPSSYDDRRLLSKIGAIEVGRHATFIGEVKSASDSASRGRFRQGFEVVVEDETGSVELKWFRAAEALKPMLREGTRLCASGDVRRHRFAKQIVHPEIEVLPPKEDGEGDNLEAFRRIVPVYPQASGMSARGVRRLVEASVSQYSDAVARWVPEETARAQGLPEPAEALRSLHGPPADSELAIYRDGGSTAHRCLVLEELYLLELGLALRHSQASRRRGWSIDIGSALCDRFVSELPFDLTPAQKRSWNEILADLTRPHPMNRLLQGDVGSGKTVLAYLAARAVASCGQQTALVAPTELLAEQHLRSLRRLEKDCPEKDRLRMELLSSSLSRAEAGTVLRGLKSGELDLVVGTHALLQEHVRFAELALAVVDEQHRFGVLQRAVLLDRGPGERVPHALVMTATPIPRTLSLTLYGDLDLSVIDELPPGRTPVQSHLLRAGEGERILAAVAQTVSRGEQVYVVYPLVEKSEKVDLRNAVESARRLAAALPEATVDLVHGRLDPAERGGAMARFEGGETQILVATSVIEVGVDVPNATLMVVEHAERFGLAQLHQLRGRVGRGSRPGRCIFVSRGGGENSEARLSALLSTTDGFRIADADLQIRGPGEFLGTRQHGVLPDLRIADLLRDTRLISVAREAAFEAVRLDPDLSGNPSLRREVKRRWGARISLSKVG